MLAAPLLPPDVEHTDEVVYNAMRSLRFPVGATIKEDGIRGLRRNCFVSRTLKLIPNDRIRERANKLPYGFDVEISNRSLMYNDIESIVMSGEHPDSDKILFYVLDWFNEDLSYQHRIQGAFDWCVLNPHPDVIAPYITICKNAAELLAFEKLTIEKNGEGICFRTLDSPYKQGRSTLQEQWLVKLARYVRSECTIIGFIEQEENLNRRRHNSVGMMARSKSISGMRGKDTLGAFLVKDSTGLEFKVGSGVGLTTQLRKSIWKQQDKYMNKQITIKHKAHGRLVKPRSPIFVGFREEGF